MNTPAESPREAIPSLWIAEFMCWMMVVLAPLLSWVNGPSVSTDQFVVRVTVFAVALGGGVGLRIYKFLRGWRSRRVSS